eukprot:gene6856-10517_t
MDLYYPFPEVAEIDRLVTQCGRAAHMLRNHVQGNNGLAHPEVSVCDHLCGQIEGQLRSVAAHAEQEKEFRHVFSPVAKAAIFLRKVYSDTLFTDPSVPEATRAEMQALAEAMFHAVKRINHLLDHAILTDSASIFGEPTPRLPHYEEHAADATIESYFNPPTSKYASYLTLGVDIPPQVLRTALAEVGCHLSNKAHTVQEVCCRHTMRRQTAPRDAAAHAVNVAGQAENEGRAVVEKARERHGPNFDAIAALLDGLGDRYGELARCGEDPNFPDEEKGRMSALVDEGL